MGFLLLLIALGEIANVTGDGLNTIRYESLLIPTQFLPLLLLGTFESVRNSFILDFLISLIIPISNPSIASIFHVAPIFGNLHPPTPRCDRKLPSIYLCLL